MDIEFWKMHGAQNDFILVDNRARQFPASDRAFIAKIGARASGIGAEGVILLEPSATCDFRMTFFNPDGGAASMCGNGARCAARLAHELGFAGATMTIDTGAGPIRAQVFDAAVHVQMPDPTGWQVQTQLKLDAATYSYGFVNTGVPHVVIRVESVDEVDVCAIGSAVRWHERFAPEGTNVDFVEVAPDAMLRVRTYERGVEAETLACGTGATACALVAARNGWVELPASVRVRSGDRLRVAGAWANGAWRDVSLSGPTEHVFKGVVEYARPGEERRGESR